MIREVKPLYLSATGKGLVTRFGTDTHIGAKLVPQGTRPNGRTGPVRIEYDKDEVVLIPSGEAALYRREYAKALAAGDVVSRSKEDFDAWTKTAEARDQKAVDDQKAADAKLTADKLAATDKATREIADTTRRMKEAPAERTAKKGDS